MPDEKKMVLTLEGRQWWHVFFAQGPAGRNCEFFGFVFVSKLNTNDSWPEAIPFVGAKK